MTYHWTSFLKGIPVADVVQKRSTSMKIVEEKQEFLKDRGIIILDDEIDEGTAFKTYLEILYSGLSGRWRGKPLLIILNTPGGQVDQGFAIYDSIRMLVEAGQEVHILGLGLIASMGTVIMQAGTKRLATPHSQFLVHQVSQSIGFFGNEEVTKLRERSDELDRLNDIVMGIIAKRCNIGLEELKKLCKKTDYWVDPPGALKLGTNGLIDEVTVLPDVLKELFSK